MPKKVRSEHDWWKSISRQKDEAGHLHNTIQHSKAHPSVHDFDFPRFPQTLPGQKFSSTLRASTSEFTLIEKRSKDIPFHTAPRTQLKSSMNQRGTFSRGGRRNLSRPQTTMGPYSIMDPSDMAFDETIGIICSNAPLQHHSDEAVRKGTPGPGRYGIPDERLCTSTSKRPVSLSMSKGKKPFTPIDWIIKRAKDAPSAHSYDQPLPPKIHGGKLQNVVPTYLDHMIRRSKTEPGPFEYSIDQKIDKGRRFNTSNTLNWAEQAIRKSRFTPSVHEYADAAVSYLQTNIGAPFPIKGRDDGTGAFDALVKTASDLPSCCSYTPINMNSRPTSTHIRGIGQAMTMAPRITDVDILMKTRAATPGPRGAPNTNRKGDVVRCHDRGPPFLKTKRDLNDSLMLRESRKPGPTSYDVTDDDDYFRQKNYGGAFNRTKKSNPFDDKTRLENKINFLNYPSTSKKSKRRRRKKMNEIKKMHSKQRPKRYTKISISCRCMGQNIYGIKVNGGIKEAALLLLLKQKMHSKVKNFVSKENYDRFVLVEPYTLLNNTSLEIAPPIL